MSQIKNVGFVFWIGLMVLGASAISVDAFGGKTGFSTAEGQTGGPPVFEDVDADGNGLIERKEGAEFFDTYETLEAFNAEFDYVDSNGDGVVDRGEFDTEVNRQTGRVVDIGGGSQSPPAELIEKRNAALQTVVDGISELLSGIDVDETNAPALLPLLHSFGPHKGPKGDKDSKGGPRMELPEDVTDALAGIAEALARVHELEAELAGHAGPQSASELTGDLK